MNNQALFVVLCKFCQRILDNDPKSGPNLQMDNHHHPRTTRITLDSLLRAKIKTMRKVQHGWRQNLKPLTQETIFLA